MTTLMSRPSHSCGVEEEESGNSQRQRRAERAAETKRKALPKKTARRLLIAVVVALVIVGAVAAWRGLQAASDGCPGHWHGGYAIYIEDEKLTFPNQSTMAYGAAPADHVHHIHADDGIYHYHPQVNRCISTEAMMQRLGVQVSDGGLTIDLQHPGFTGHHATDANNTLRILHQPSGEAWRNVTWAEIDGKQLGNGDRILITYGHLTDEMVAAQQAAMPELGPGYQPDDV